MSSSNLSTLFDRVRPWLTLAAILGTIVVNYVSNAFPVNGATVSTIAKTVFANVQIIPANYAFSIWGLIFLSLIGFGIYQLQPAQQRDPRLQRAGVLLIGASVLQSAWVYVFMLRWFVLSMLVMGSLLGTLIAAYLALGIGKDRYSRQGRWFVQYPMGLYLGWISVATVVNVAIALYSLGWDGWGISPMGWTGILAIVTAGLGAGMVALRRDWVYAGVIVWALVALGVRHLPTLLGLR